MPAALDQPPPSPQLAAAGGLPPGGPTPSFGGLAGENPMGAPAPDMNGLLQLAMQVDDSLLLFAQAAPQASVEISQARDLMKAALAKVVTSPGMPGAMTGTAPGNQFPGASPSMR